jgi:DNA-binding PadR family transcriptional regulator
MKDRQRLPLEQALLGLLMRGPLHGYDLHRLTNNELGRIWYMGMSNIYNGLRRLETTDYVESVLTSQGSRPPRKVYRITRAGRKAFRDWVRQPTPTIRRLRVELPAKLYFLRTLGLKGAEKLISDQRSICQERIEQLTQNAIECEHDDFDRLVFDFRCRQIKSIVDWLDTHRTELIS